MSDGLNAPASGSQERRKNVISRDLYNVLQNLQLRLNAAVEAKDANLTASLCWKEKCEKAEAELSVMKKRLEEMQPQHSTFLEVSQASLLWKAKCEKAEADAQDTQDVLKDTQKQYTSLLQDCLDARQKHVDEKNAEIWTLRGFLSTSNESSEMEVIELLDLINDKAEHVATQTSLSSVFRPELDRGEGPAMEDGMWDALKTVLGETFVSYLSSLGADEVEPLHLQLSWQSIIIYVVGDLLQAPFTTTGTANEQDAPSLGQIASLVERTEIQPVYGHWRAITARCLRLAQSEDEALAHRSALSNHAIYCCYLAGLVLLKGRCPSCDTFVSTFTEQVTELLGDALRLASMIHEDIIGKNFLPYAPVESDLFDPGTMDSESGRPPLGEIFCTARLGLLYTCKPKREKTVSSGPVVFRKPQIISLESFNDEKAQDP